MASRFREHYDNIVKGELQKQFGYKNPMQVPKVKKIVINMGVGEATGDSKVITAASSKKRPCCIFRTSPTSTRNSISRPVSAIACSRTAARFAMRSFPAK